MKDDDRETMRARASADDAEDDDREGEESGRLDSLKARVDRVTSGAALALEVAGLKDPTRPLGKKRMLVSSGLSLVFGPFGFLYAAPLREAVPAIVAYLAVGWVLNLILPSFIIGVLFVVVNIVAALAGGLYAWGFNSAGKRVPLILKEKDGGESPPLRKLLVKEKK